MTTFTIVITSIGWYLIVGMLVYLCVAKPPKAEQLIGVAEEYPSGMLVVMLICAVVWPLLIYGAIMRALFPTKYR
jgi:hypothetical protein